MAYTYTKLTEAQRKQIAEQQVEQFERELFGHELNLARLKAQGLATDESKEALVAIEKAIATTMTEAAKLDATTVPKPPGKG